MEQGTAREDEAHGLSLWLCPEDPVQARLEDLIETLAARLGTRTFAPHVTLVGGLSIPEAAARAACGTLAARIPPLRVRSAGLSESDRFFRCIVVELERTPELESARQVASTALGVPPSPFFPHVSLVYGRLAISERRALIRSLAARPDLAGLDLDLSTLELVLTAGPTSAWKRLDRVPLGLP